MRNLDLDALQIFQAVAAHGGVSKAAARLHRVQSNISTRLQQLEQQLGTPLFDRQPRRWRLTGEGEVLLGYADRLLRLSVEAEAALRDRTPRGTLRLGTLESAAAARLPPLLARYHARYPEVNIELATGTTGALLERLRRHELDAAFVSEPFDAPDLEADTAFTEELVLVAPRGTPAPRAGDRPTVIAFPTGCSYRRRLEQWLAQSGVLPTRVMEFGSYHALVACVAAGAGVAVVPRSVVAVLKMGRSVVQHPLPAALRVSRTRLVRPPGAAPGALEALRGLLREPAAAPAEAGGPGTRRKAAARQPAALA